MTATKKTFTPFSLGQIVATRGVIESVLSISFEK